MSLAARVPSISTSFGSTSPTYFKILLKLECGDRHANHVRLSVVKYGPLFANPGFTSACIILLALSCCSVFVAAGANLT